LIDNQLDWRSTSVGEPDLSLLIKLEMPSTVGCASPEASPSQSYFACEQYYGQY